jgi:hypothetical protein
MSEKWPRTKNNCADDSKQWFTQKQVSHDPEVTVGSAHKSRGISTCQIPGATVIFVVLVCKSHSQKPQEALNLLVTEEHY